MMRRMTWTGITLLGSAIVAGLVWVRVGAAGEQPLTLEMTARSVHYRETDEVKAKREYWQGSPLPLNFTVYYLESKIEKDRRFNERRPPVPDRTLRIAPASGAWTDLVRLHVRRKSGLGHEVITPNTNWRSCVDLFSGRQMAVQQIGAASIKIGFVFPPGVTQQWQPGEYSVSVEYDSRSAAGVDWRGKVASEPFQFTIRAAEDNASRAQLLYEWAVFAFHREKDAKKSAKLARQSVDLAPGDDRAWRQLGDALYRDRQWQPALDAYERYLELAPPDDPTGAPRREIAEGAIRQIRMQLEMEQNG